MNNGLNRRLYIGGSDAYRLMKGEWLALYEEKLGIREEENLSQNFQVQLGKVSEPLHFAWVDRYHHALLPGTFAMHRELPFIAGHVDGWVITLDTFVELKHVRGGVARRDVVETYLPQLAHYCNVHDRDTCFLSFIAGNADPEVVAVTPPLDYRFEIIELEKALWWCVENKSPPDLLPKKILGRANEKAADVKIDGMRFVDMSTNNEWAVAAFDFITSIEAAIRSEEAKARIKALVEPDVGEAIGHGVCVKRNKKGTLVLTLTEQ